MLAVGASSRNPRAKAALVVGALAVLSAPGLAALPRYTTVRLLDVVYGFPVPILLGLVAVAQARRARELLERTLWGAGGERQAAWGRGLGMFAVCLGITGGLAVGFYWILVAFSH